MCFHVSSYRTHISLRQPIFIKMLNVMPRFIDEGMENRARDRSELTQNFNLHWFLRRVIVLIPGGARVLSLVALPLDVLDGQGAIRNTLSHVCGQFDII